LKAVDNNYIVSQMSQNAAVLQNQNTNQQLIEQRNFWFSSDHFSKFSSILFKIPKISLFFIDRLSKSSLPRWPQGLLPLRDLGDEQQHHGGQRQRGDLQVRSGSTAIRVDRQSVRKGSAFLQGDQNFRFQDNI
jgi:hypothetical protein